MYAYPFYPQRNTSSLDGFWQFAFLGSDSPLDDFVNTKSIVYDDIMQVPGCFDATCKYIGKRGLAVYKRMVNVSAPGRYRLILHAIGLAGKVFCNGKEPEVKLDQVRRQVYVLEEAHKQNPLPVKPLK